MEHTGKQNETKQSNVCFCLLHVLVLYKRVHDYLILCCTAPRVPEETGLMHPQNDSGFYDKDSETERRVWVDAGGGIWVQLWRLRSNLR